LIRADLYFFTSDEKSCRFAAFVNPYVATRAKHLPKGFAATNPSGDKAPRHTGKVR
jgi:hypothetical protein